MASGIKMSMKTRGLKRANKFLKKGIFTQIEGGMREGNREVAEILKEIISKQISGGRTGPSLSGATSGKKGFGKTLVDSGQLAESVIIQEDRQTGKFFVGFPKKGPRRKARDEEKGTSAKMMQMGPLAKMLAEGKRIKVTDKMRRFVAVRFGFFISKSTSEIIIPPRPFMEKAFKKASKDTRIPIAFRKAMQKEINKGLK